MNNNKPKLVDVANLAGVSVTTASQVIRGVGRISEATAIKVRHAAQQLNYIPNARAASMRSGTNNEIGFVINQISNPFNAEVISGASDRLEEAGYLLSVLDARDNADRQERQIRAFIKSGRAGLIWVPAAKTKRGIYDLLRSQRVPTVTFLRSPTFSGFDHIGIANFEATSKATHHLLSLGHTKIAYFGGTNMTDVRKERIEGYTQTLTNATGSKTIIWDCEDNRLAGLNAVIELRNKHPEVTALVCNGDNVALGAEMGLQRKGLVAGKDVSIIGFDDITDAAASTPALTTMGVCPYQLGCRLANTLLERLQHPNSPRISTLLEAELIIRETTGMAADERNKA